jgi:hypothetical protein
MDNLPINSFHKVAAKAKAGNTIYRVDAQSIDKMFVTRRLYYKKFGAASIPMFDFFTLNPSDLAITQVSPTSQAMIIQNNHSEKYFTSRRKAKSYYNLIK